MNRRFIFAAVAAFISYAPSSHGALISYFAVLSGPAESPPNASPASGTALVDVDSVANTMRVRVSFTGLLGTTTASHIHAATTDPFTGTAGVATQTPTFVNFPLGVTSGTYDMTFDLTAASTYNPAYVTANGGTTVSARAALLDALGAGKAYYNIHTSFAPGGEIRGFLAPVPEPSSLVLLGAGASVLGLRLQTRGRRA